jgi:signal recognition particle GTPase
MDEAGDLGFKSTSSCCCVIAYVIVPSATPHYIRNKSCRLLHKLNQKLQANRKISEFKFSRDYEETRIKFLKLIDSFGLDAGVVVVRKDSVKRDLQDYPVILYNYLAVNYVVPIIVENYLKSTYPTNRIKFKIDRSLSKSDRAKFNEYFDEKISWIKRQQGFKNDIFAEIEHENSQNDVCLQIADYIAGSIFRKVEHNDPQYYELVKNRIKFKQKWDWNEKITW